VLGGVLKLGCSLKEMDKGARFFVDLGESAPLAAAVMIKGAYELKGLGIKGEASIRLGSEGFELKQNQKVFAYESNYTVGWDWSMKHFLMRGQYAVAGVGTMGFALLNALFKLTTAAVEAAVTAVSMLVKTGIPGAKTALRKSKNLAESVCNSMSGMKKKVCHKALNLSTRSVSAVFNAAKAKAAEKLLKASSMMKKVPSMMLSKVGLDMSTLFAANSSTIQVMNNILTLNLFEYRLELDGGSLEANMIMDVVALGKQKRVSFKSKLNDFGGLAKTVFKHALGFFERLVQNSLAAAKQVLASASQASKKLLMDATANARKLVISKMSTETARRVASATKDKAIAAKNKAKSMASNLMPFGRRRRRRRRKYFTNLREAGESDRNPARFEYGSDGYLGAIIDGVLAPH